MDQLETWEKDTFDSAQHFNLKMIPLKNTIFNSFVYLPLTSCHNHLLSVYTISYDGPVWG